MLRLQNVTFATRWLPPGCATAAFCFRESVAASDQRFGAPTLPNLRCGLPTVAEVVTVLREHAQHEDEEAGQGQVWERAGEARLAAGMTAFKRSRTLDQSLAGWADMLPAMNAVERQVHGRAR